MNAFTHPSGLWHRGGDPLVAAHPGQRRQEGLPGDALLLQASPGGGARALVHQRQQQVLDRDVLVLEPPRLPFRGVQQARQPLGDRLSLALPAALLALGHVSACNRHTARSAAAVNAGGGRRRLLASAAMATLISRNAAGRGDCGRRWSQSGCECPLMWSQFGRNPAA
jgi:hypothetical protein